MSPQVQPTINIEALLAPIPGDNPAGVYVKPLGVYDQIKNFRITVDAEGMAGKLKDAEAVPADFKKVVKLCVEELTNRSKDLQLVVWLSEAVAKLHGFTGIEDGLNLAIGLHENYWPIFYPVIEEEEDIEMRSGRIDEMDRLLAKTIREANLTKTVEGTFAVWQWHQVRKIAEGANQVKEEDERAAAIAEATTRREELDKAIAKTPAAFYLTQYETLKRCNESVEKFRALLEEKFKSEPGYHLLDGPPNLADLRSTLQSTFNIVENILRDRGALPKDAEETAVELVEEAGGVVAAVSTTTMAYSGPGIPMQPVDRADALRRLNAIAEFFQRTEPHSPVAYLVQRAARWGSMPLDKWLEEVISDGAVLEKIKDTLGLARASGDSSGYPSE